MLKYISVLGLLFIFLDGPCQGSWTKVTEELITQNPTFKACHASTLVENSSNEIMVSFFAGSHEGNKDVSIWLTKKKNKKWGDLSCMANCTQDSTLFPTWNPVLFKAISGKLFLYYKVGPNPKDWWGMFRKSADNGKSWSTPERLKPGFLGPVKNKPVQLSDGTILSASSTETTNRWQVHIERSVDEGKTWTYIPVDTGNTYKVIQPSILVYPDNRLQLVCRSNQDKIVEAWSSDNGLTWGSLTKLEVNNPNSGIDAVTLQNGWQLLVYNPTISGKEWFNSRGKLNVAISKDGKVWNDILVLEDGKDEDEYSYPAVIQSKDGRVHITYTFNRKNIKYVELKEN